MLGIVVPGDVLIIGGIGALFLKEALSTLEELKRIGIYVTPGIKKETLEGWTTYFR